MIDTILEPPVPLALAARELPRRRAGRKTHVSTLYRWASVGCRGVVLETISVGCTLCTSKQVLQRFFERISQSRQAGGAGGNQPGPGAGQRTTAQRQRAAAEAGRKLAQMGA